jgi:hypothetical protein
MNPPEDDNIHAASWALPVTTLKTEDISRNAINLNVDGRRLTGPLKGFGQLWQKTYRVRMTGASVAPAQIIDTWKKNFEGFWPRGNHFYGSVIGIAPGEVAVLNLAVPGGPPITAIATGVMVIYADDLSFCFMTPEGHMFAGMITFSAEEDTDGTPVAQIQVLIRAMDPIYELGCRLGVVHKGEDAHWQATLKNLAKHFGGQNINVEQHSTLVDPRVQWSEYKNVWHNAAIRTALYMPVAITKRLFRGG